MLTKNLLLATLSAGDAAAIQPFLKSIHLPHRKILFEAGDLIDACVYRKPKPGRNGDEGRRGSRVN